VELGEEIRLDKNKKHTWKWWWTAW